MWKAEESLCCMELDNVVRHLYCVINLLFLLKETYGQLRTGTLFFLRCVIPVVCVTNGREENVVKQHN